ncbi:hypothetical protein DPMN_025608 [Dreissena polymorpha]|uniref:Uncharacterized protein n=1 Tax=Dreissena polymorpha TaxID=45954 RepID=A0A9D4LRT7_DREPO|nr:hypothetical protein DPMN_025608 [Dreissena polymorpha]
MKETPKQSSTVPRPPGHLQETARQYNTVSEPSWHLQGLRDILRRCQTISQTVWKPAGDSQSV